MATLIFGVAVVFWPGLTLLTLLYIFSIYVVVAGIVNVMAGVGSAGKVDTWFLPALLGVFELGVGVYLLRHVDVKFSTFILLIGFTLIAHGVVEAVHAYFNAGRAAARARTMGYVSGLVALVAGIVILFAKQADGVKFVWVLGLYGLIIGTLYVAELSESVK